MTPPPNFVYIEHINKLLVRIMRQFPCCSGSIGVGEAQDNPRLLRQEHCPEDASVQEQSGLLLRVCSFPWDLFGWELSGKLFVLILGTCEMLPRSLYSNQMVNRFLFFSGHQFHKHSPSWRLPGFRGGKFIHMDAGETTQQHFLFSKETLRHQNISSHYLSQQ